MDVVRWLGKKGHILRKATTMSLGTGISAWAVPQETKGKKAESRLASISHDMTLKRDLQPYRFAVLFFCGGSLLRLMESLFEDCSGSVGLALDHPHTDCAFSLHVPRELKCGAFTVRHHLLNLR